MDQNVKELVLRYQPYIYQDRLEPFPIRFIGYSVFAEKKQSASFPKWVVDPSEENVSLIIEYAIYYDYDIQHMYDLEHIWVGIDEKGNVVDCWCSFHGMRLRAAGVSAFCLEGCHPMLYSQPGKHAMLPHPELFELHPQFHVACTAEAGGGLLLPSFLDGVVETNDKLNKVISDHICERFPFVPSMDFVREELSDDQFICWTELLAKIPELIAEQIAIILSG